MPIPLKSESETSPFFWEPYRLLIIASRDKINAYMPSSADILNWVSAGSTLIAAIGTIGAATIALYSAKQSAQSALDSKRSSQASLMPIIEPREVCLCSESNSGETYFELRMTNVGKGLAQDIHVSIPQLNFTKVLSTSIKPDDALHWTRSPIHQSNAAQWEQNRGTSINILLSYSDIFGNRIATRATAVLEIASFRLDDFQWTVEYL